MSSLIIQSETLDDIADAIRAKTGKSASMTPLEMPQEIASISGGGGMTETLIWSNSDPSATFNGKDITLTNSMDNYDAIKITWMYNRSGDPTGNSLRYTISPVFTPDGTTLAFRNVSSGTADTRGSLCVINTSDVTYVRPFCYKSTTVIHFYACTRTGASATQNNNCLPVKVYGINY